MFVRIHQNPIRAGFVVATLVSIVALLASCTPQSDDSATSGQEGRSAPTQPSLSGGYLARVELAFPPGAPAAGLSDRGGLAWVEFDSDQRLTSYEGILPGYTEAGTAQVHLDLVAGTIQGTITNEYGDEVQLADLLPGLIVSSDGTPVGFIVEFADESVSYTYAARLGLDLVLAPVAFSGDMHVSRQTTRDGQVLLADSADGRITAGQWPVDEARLPLPPAPTPIRIDAGSDLLMRAGDSVVLRASAAGGVGKFEFAWEPPATLSDPTLLQPTARPTQTTTYTVTVADDTGALASDMVTITVDTSAPPTLEDIYGRIDYSFVSRGVGRWGNDVPVFKDDSEPIRQIVKLPDDADPDELEIAYVRPDGQHWAAPAPTTTTTLDGGTRFDQGVPVAQLPNTGLWTTVATYDGLIVGAKQFVVQRPFGLSSEILIVNADRDSPLLAVGAGAEGNVRYYLGSRHRDGVPNMVQVLLEAQPDGRYLGYHFDDDRKLVGLSAEDGSFLEWSPGSNGAYHVTAGSQGAVKWSAEVIPAGGRSLGGNTSGGGGTMGETGDQLTYVSLQAAVGFTSGQHQAANQELQNVMSAPHAVRPAGVPSYVSRIGTLMIPDTNGNPFFNYNVPGNGLSHPNAQSDVGRVGEEMIAVTRGFSEYVAGSILEQTFGSNLIAATPSEAVLGFIDRWVGKATVVGVAVVGIGSKLGWTGIEMAMVLEDIKDAGEAYDVVDGVRRVFNMVEHSHAGSGGNGGSWADTFGRAFGNVVSTVHAAAFGGASESYRAGLPSHKMCDGIRAGIEREKSAKRACGDQCGADGESCNIAIVDHESAGRWRKCFFDAYFRWKSCHENCNAPTQAKERELGDCQAQYGTDQ